ncbi:MAG: hypothetical protein IID45_13865 [Planctomycetes bacterium]|nr:hypothetical protein [Planctomycetota bacterium]
MRPPLRFGITYTASLLTLHHFMVFVRAMISLYHAAHSGISAVNDHLQVRVGPTGP